MTRAMNSLFLSGVLIVISQVGDASEVFSMSPQYGSLAGGTKLTILGVDFSILFSMTDTSIGNRITLVSDKGHSLPCPLHQAGSSHDVLMCYTPQNMERDVAYYIKVTVDGVSIPDSKLCASNRVWCSITAHYFYSPSITSLSTHSAQYGEMMTIFGRIVTDRYGSNIAKSTNGREEKLLRVYTGGENCLLKDGDNFYGLSVNSETSYDGNMTCRINTTLVGYVNVTYLVESPFGRSWVRDWVYRMSWKDKMYVLELFTNVTGISPSSGSTEGGTNVTVQGYFFEDSGPKSTYSKAMVKVGGVAATGVTAETDGDLYFEAPKQPDSLPSSFSGGRGVLVEYWDTQDPDYSVWLASTTTPLGVEWFDETRFCGHAVNMKYTRMTGRYKPTHGGKYKFQAKCTNGCAFYKDGTLLATSTGNWASSGEQTLVGGNEYTLVVLAKGGSNAEACVELKALFYNSPFNNLNAAIVTPETVTISVTSTVLLDRLALKFSGFSPSAPTNEVQEICLSGGSSNINLTMFGATTVPFSIGSAPDAEVALNNLPWLTSEETFSVVDSTTANCLVITLSSFRGDLPKFTSDSSITVTETTNGVANGSYVIPQMDNKVGNPIVFMDDPLFANDIKASLESLFSVKCPKSIVDSSLFYNQDYESSSGANKEEIPFSGRASMENPSSIFQGNTRNPLNIGFKPWLCFAVRNLTNDNIYFSYTTPSGNTRNNRRFTFVPKSVVENGMSWNYTCINMLTTIKGENSGESSDYFIVNEIKLRRASTDPSFFVDAVTIRNSDPTSNLENLSNLCSQLPVGGDSQPLLMKDISVTYNSGTSSFDVILSPANCGYDLQLLTLAGGTVSAGSSAASSSSVTSTLSQGPAMELTRSESATEPLTGSIAITYEGNSSPDIDVQELNVDRIQMLLESTSGIGKLSVERMESSTCSNVDLKVKFLSLPGDLSDLTATSMLTAPSSAAVSITENVAGHLPYDPIPGNQIFTSHDSPQVQVFINDVPLKCSLADHQCDWTWSSSATPTITGLDKSSGAYGTVLTITGTQFSTTAGANTVTIGGVPCDVTSESATQLVCTVGDGPLGQETQHPVVVMVDQIGRASGSHMFTYTAVISSVSPTSGSVSGGMTMTINGNGFTPSSEITINSQPCPLTGDVTSSLIYCAVPAHTDLTIASSVEVSVDVTGGTSSATFTYSPSSTATITSITGTDDLKVTGGQTIVITGSGFGSTGSVYIGPTLLTPGSYSDTSVTVTTPAGLKPGAAQNLNVLTESRGTALLSSTNAIPTVDVILKLSGMTPLQGSVYGGTRLTLDGEGFGADEDKVNVTIGNHKCVLQELTDTKITCDIDETGAVYTITNDGNTGFGPYYSFSVTTVEVEQGDTINFKWRKAESVNNVNYKICQTPSLTSEDCIEGGIDSGPATPIGEYNVTLSVLGKVYFWSGYVDEYNIKNFRTTINVVAKADFTGDVVVQVAGQDASHDTSSPTTSSSTGCSPLTADISGCTPSSLTANNPSTFKFTTCKSPVLTSVTYTYASMVPRSATNSTVFTFQGTGFASNDCANKAKIGDFPCIATSSSSTSFQCTISSSSSLEYGVLMPVSLSVLGYGYAITAIPSFADRYVALVPSVTRFSPTSGSTAGGSVVTIEGDGLDQVTSVTFGSYDATCDFGVSPLVCTTPPSTASAVNISVYDGAMKGSCTGSCLFTYSTASTPTVTAVSPAVGGSTTLTFTGTQFGTDSSKVTVQVGGETCSSVNVASETSLTCSVAAIPAGSNNVINLVVQDKGAASATGVFATGTPLVDPPSPSQGSTHGGLALTFSGHGFSGETTVTDGSNPVCKDVTTTLTTLSCTTLPHAAGTVNFAITSNGETFPSVSFEYAADATPEITGVSPGSGVAGTTLVITGQKISTDASKVAVTIGGTPCTVDASSVSETSVSCEVQVQTSGTYNVAVAIDGKGLSNNGTFNYQVSVTQVSPTAGDNRGGQLLTITGSGISDSTTATVCGADCPVVSSTFSSLICETPPGTDGTACDVVVTEGTVSTTATDQYTYNTGTAPTVTSVSPQRGGTGGGTTVTITGTGFSSPSVSVAGSAWTVTSSTATEIICTTSAHAGSTTANVTVTNADSVRAVVTSGNEFSYVDVWSSVATWGGNSIPAEGEMVVIPKGQTILLDTDTPVLSALLINGGQLIFDEKDIILRSYVILINDGGLLQVGTADKPFEHNATILMYGHVRSPELPIYGAKVIAVRNGTLDLHGKPLVHTWTLLDGTVQPGATQITLVDAVPGWEVGYSIVIACTGHRHSQGKTEERVITAVTNNGRTLTLDKPLEYVHFGEDETHHGATIKMRAEVGLLTRNVKVMGNQNTGWDQDIEACEDGFNTGEFATQTCFQGRFGEEEGSDQIGVTVMIHQSASSTGQEAQAHLSYTEINFAGQAFRLGRYPVHFHLNGDMSMSYVKGCAIHKTFNRAVNVHGSHNALVENNVIYDVMGGALFLEDGIETGNTFRYNLAIFVKSSTSLLNDDVTPAAMWVTNPNNTVTHNHFCCGTHFAIWLRMHEHPDGPSFTESICPRRVPLGIFQNNTAHSQGWFGVWVFQAYFPNVEARCDGNADVAQAVIHSMTVWNCEKGVELVDFGAIVFEDLVSLQNEKAGAEFKLAQGMLPGDAPKNAGCKNCVIAGQATSVALRVSSGVTDVGIVAPFGEGVFFDGVKFSNLDGNPCFKFTEIQGTCSDKCGGWTIQVRNIVWPTMDGTYNKILMRWEHEVVIEDLDGSFVGSASAAGSKIVPKVGTCFPNTCVKLDHIHPDGVDVYSCPASMKFHRLAFNKINPSSLEGKNLSLTNSYGSCLSYYRTHRITHAPGWTAALINNEMYTFTFVNAENMVNISFNGVFGDYRAGECNVVRFYVMEEPDNVKLNSSSVMVPKYTGGDGTFTCETSGVVNGDWFYKDNYVHVALKGPDAAATRKRRSSSSAGGAGNEYNMNAQLSVVKCFFAGCEPPPDPELLPPADERPDPFSYWSDTSIWAKNESTNMVVNTGSGSYGLPQAGDSVYIQKEGSANWVVIKEITIPKLDVVYIEGGLEIDYSTNYNYVFEANFIIIVGGRFVVGWPNNPMTLGTATITMHGSCTSTPYTELKSSPTLSTKAIGVFGGFDAHGKDIGATWVKLNQTAEIGASELFVEKNMIDKWSVGDTVIISSTSFNPAEKEEKVIQSIDAAAGKITLDSALTYMHRASVETHGSSSTVFAATVANLKRSVVVQGSDSSDTCGGRIMVSAAQIENDARVYTGFARIENVQFLNMGHEGFTESYDPRFALTYLGISSNRTAKPCYVRRNSFSNLKSTAVGLFGAEAVGLYENVIYGAVGTATKIASHSNELIRNLVGDNRWTGSYNGRNEAFNFRYEALINAIDATNLTLKHNYAVGSERRGYFVPGWDCAESSTNYEGNYAVGCLMGVGIMPKETIPSAITQSCVTLSGFILWKNFDYGIYYNNEHSVVLSNNIYADNGLGALPMVYGPSSLAHLCEFKTATIQDSVFIGTLTGAVCSSETSPSGTYISLSGNCRCPKGPQGATIGALLGTFSSGSNNAQEKPCSNIMSYNAICGNTTIKGTTFKNFGAHASCKDSFAIAAPKFNDDLIHPSYLMDNSYVSVNENNKILIDRPNLGKINPSDCVDMDCDGLKKVLVTDIDGTTWGTPLTTVFSESEYEWDGDPRRGLGDYRIPTSMLADFDGTGLSADTVFPHGRGIARNSDCTKVSGSNFAYHKCTGTKYRMMVIESLDADTEVRRLSPVGIGALGYVDLINGPQDHGWCSGYTCQKRLSTFHAVVPMGMHASVHLSSTQPDRIRFFLLDADDDDCVLVSFFYLNPYRIDIFKDDGNTHVLPKNGKIEDGVFKYLNAPGTVYLPSCTVDDHGSNYINKTTKMLYFILKGQNKLVLQRAEEVLVSFTLPAMTVDQFYSSNIIENVAGLLNIPLDHIRVVEIVSESSGRRRKRSTGTTVTLEIGEPPADTAFAADSTSTDPVTDIAGIIMDGCQDGSLSSALGMDTSCNEIMVDDVTYTPAVPAELRFETDPVAEHEGVPFATQPKLRAYDSSGNVIDNLGIMESPWEVTVTLRSGSGHASAVLSGTTTLASANGWFNFTNLAISHAGSGYYIDFEVSSPTGTNLTAEFSLNVDPLPMSTGIFSKTTDIVQASPFSMTLDLRDATTDVTIPDVTWRGHTQFDVTCGQVADMETGTLTGTFSRTFDMASGQIEFDDLVFSGYGLIYIACRVESTPAEYDFTSYHKVTVLKTNHVGIPIQKTERVTLRFIADFATTLPTDAAKAQLHQAVLQEIAVIIPDIIISESTITAGSILISFTVEGGSSNVTAALTEVCNSVSSGLSVTIGGSTLTLDGFMTVDGANFYATCGRTDDDDEDDGLHPGFIALIAILCLLVIAAIIFLVVWRCKIRPNMKTHGANRWTVREYADNGRTVFLAGPNQKVEDIFYKQKQTTGLAPITTLYDNQGMPSVRKSPNPPDPNALYDRELTQPGV